MISFPSTPCVFNLKISPLYQTLSKALEISRKIPLKSSGEVQSNDVWISWVIDSSYEIQESPGMKPD